jgi:hypothetical protein
MFSTSFALEQSETSQASYLFPSYVLAGLITAKISGNKIISWKMPNTRNRQSNWRPFSNAQLFICARIGIRSVPHFSALHHFFF